MRQIYYKSDFSLQLRLRDIAGNAIDLSKYDIDFQVLLYTTSRAINYKVGRTDGVLNGVEINGETLAIAVDNNRIPIGQLTAEATLYWPDDSHPDGSRKEVITTKLDIEVVKYPTDNSFDADINLPVIEQYSLVKGYIEIITDMGNTYQVPVAVELCLN